MLLGVGRQTSNVATRGEIGRYPLILSTYVAMVKYWIRLQKLPSDELIADTLKCSEELENKGIFSWVTMIKFILQQAGLPEVWHNPVSCMTTNTCITETIKKNLKQQYQKVFFSINL
jgi:hypothetical protein